MKKNIVLATVVSCLLIFASVSAVLANEVVWEDIAGGYSDVRAALVGPHNPSFIYIGAKNSVLKTEDGGLTWRNVLSVKGENKNINFLFCNPYDNNSIYAATGNGLFFSQNQGKSWKRIFQGKNYFEKECTSLVVLPEVIYLGTKQGLFVSKDKGRTWQKEISGLGNSHILAIACDLKEPETIYLACVEGVFRTKDNGQSWERIFVANPTENGNYTEEIIEDSDEEKRFSIIRYLSIDHNNAQILYLATAKGVYKSQDAGQNWEMFSSYGLLSQDVFLLAISSQSNIYALTKSGVFEYKNDRWQELSLRLVAEKINYLTLDSQNNLFAACDTGLFKASIDGTYKNQQENIIAIYYKDEPRINEVQEAAIKYAEVGMEKIIEWRRKAKIRAVLPKLTFGLDRSEDTNYEIYTSATTHYVFEGPDDKSNGWDISLSWDLADLIWNESQTSIDVRSRLMVQLRDDILDEVTKIYFERLRVKMELDNLSIEDRKKRFEKELKLQELTAQLDGLTGGYFSSQIKGKF
jgi:photosystem II stability/assembly factor-like uncharacterized protein